MRPCATTLEAEMTPEELNFMLGVMAGAALPGKHLEVGTAAGGTLWQLMRCYPEGSRPPFVVVDPMQYFPEQFKKVQENLCDHDLDPEQVDFRQTTSAKAFTLAARSKETYDFIVLDGAHKIRYITEDLRWAQLLNAGGVLCLHDYAPKFRGVMMATDRFLSRNRHYKVVGQVGSLLAVKKMKATDSVEVTARDHIFARMWAPFLNLEPSIRKRLQAIKSKRR